MDPNETRRQDRRARHPDTPMPASIPDTPAARPVVVACRVMEPELEWVRRRDPTVEVRYIDQSLHRTPRKMPALVQEQVDAAAAYATRIVLGYGLCSNGIVGVTARDQGLLVPRCHDCIGLLLGSPAAYQELFQANPGTYYITPGWVAEQKDPLGVVEHEYEPRFGRETAMWAMQEELKHYTHINLIDTGVSDLDPLRQRALENARVFQKAYAEIRGSLDYFDRLVRGPYASEYFFDLKPGQQVTLEMFLEDLY